MMGRPDGKLLRDPAAAPLPYVRGKTKAWIIGGVSFFHVGLIIIPLLFLTIMRYFDPPLLVMNIPIVDSLPNENTEMSPHPAPGRSRPSGMPDYGDPKPLTDIPDVPALPKKAEPEPIAEETPPVKEKTEPEKKEVTKKPEKVEKIQKEPPPEPTEKSVTGTKPKKTTRYKSANEIKISNKRVTLPSKNTNRGSADGDPTRREIGNMIRSLTGTPGGRGVPGGGGGPKGVLSKDISDYYNAVEAFLKRRWDQPNTEMLNRTNPKVIVRFKVDSDGRLLSAVIISKSGVNAMDASVQALLTSLKVLPPPPMAMEFLVTLEIDR